MLSAGRTIYKSFSVCYEARSTPAQPFNLHLLSHYLDKLDSVYDEFVRVSFGIGQEWLLSGLFIGAAFIALSARQSAAALRRAAARVGVRQF